MYITKGMTFNKCSLKIMTYLSNFSILRNDMVYRECFIHIEQGIPFKWDGIFKEYALHIRHGYTLVY